MRGALVMSTAAAFVAVACKTSAPAATSDAGAALAPSVTVSTPSAAPDAGDSGCAETHATKIDNGACTKNADCVLTDLPAECCACNLARIYPTLRSSLESRSSRCASETCAAACAPHDCPPKDSYTGSFYRAECRPDATGQARCIAFRYHGGG